MSKSSYELEKELKDIKEKERLESLDKELEQNQHYKNKCYATHLFSRGGCRIGTTAKFRKITDVVIYNEKVVFNITDFEYRKDITGNLYFQSNRTYYQQPYSNYDSFQYEITEAQFESLLKLVTANVDIIGDSIKACLNSPNDYITNGDFTDERNYVELLKFSEIPIIKLTDQRCKDSNISIKEILTWQHHPLLIAGKYLINNSYSKKITQKIKDDMYKHAIEWGSSIYERDKPRIDALQTFIDNTIWNDL